MTRIARYRIKNALIIANLISNAIGVTVGNLLVRISSHTIPEEVYQGIERTPLWFLPASFLFPLVLTLIYERPIRRHFEGIFDGKTSDPSASMSIQEKTPKKNTEERLLSHAVAAPSEQAFSLCLTVACPG